MNEWEEIRAKKPDPGFMRTIRKKVRIYADESVEEPVIAALSGLGINVHSAIENGDSGKPDEYHASKAFKMRRFLLTKDKGFLDNRSYPFNRTYGIIVLAYNPKKTEQILASFGHLVDLICRNEELWKGQKLVISPTQIDDHFRDEAGQDRQTTYRFKGGRVFIRAR